jgi:hypothetical protein
MIKNFSQNSFIAGAIVGVLLTGAWFLGANNSFGPALSGHASSPSDASALPKGGALSVSDQKAGAEVMIDSVTVPPPGVWLAVREVNGSDLGNVLGAVRVRGPHTGVSISLLRATEANRSYAVELYRDDNADAFDPSVNSVYVDFDTGARVVSFFKTIQ